MRKYLFALLLLPVFLNAQCRLQFSLGYLSRSQVLDNRNTQCANWTMSYTVVGTGTIVSLQTSSAATGPWSIFSGTSPSNVSNTISASGSPSYISVSKTGTGTVSGTLNGVVRTTTTALSVGGAYSDLSNNSKIGSGAGQVAPGNHTHSGYQPILAYAPEDVANKSSNPSLGASDLLYPTQNAVKTYVDAHAGTGGTSGPSLQTSTVIYSSTPAMIVQASTVMVFKITLSGPASPTLDTTLATNGQLLEFDITQDTGGNHNFTWPSNVSGGCAVSKTGGVVTRMITSWDGTYANELVCTNTEPPTLITGPTRSAPGTPATGLACWFDTTGNTWKCKDPSSNVYAAVLTTSSRTAGKFLTYIDADGKPQNAAIVVSDVPDLSATYEIVTNKSTNTALGTSDTLYPTQNAVKTYVDTHSGGGGGGAGTLPSGFGYIPLPPVPFNQNVAFTPTPGDVACFDFVPRETVTVNHMAVHVFGGTLDGVYIGYRLFDSTGTSIWNARHLLTTSYAWRDVAATGTSSGFPFTLTAYSRYSMCAGFEVAATGVPGQDGMISESYSKYGTALAIGLAGAPTTWYLCSNAPTGSGATFSLPTTCGTKTPRYEYHGIPLFTLY